MAVLADGSIVVVGVDLAANPSGVVVKFTASCQLDMSFGSNGVVSYTERDGVAYQTLVVWNNALIVGGRTYFSPADGGDSRFTIHRLDATRRQEPSTPRSVDPATVASSPTALMKARSRTLSLQTTEPSFSSERGSARIRTRLSPN
jgi:hypothetical protein